MTISLELMHRYLLAFQEMQTVVKVMVEEIDHISKKTDRILNDGTDKTLVQWDWVIAELVSYYCYWILRDMDRMADEVEHMDLARRVYMQWLIRPMAYLRWD